MPSTADIDIRFDPTDFAGCVALVTGGSSGIGAACVRLLAEAGARVHFCGIVDGLGKLLVDELAGKGRRVHYAHADVRDDAVLGALVAGVLKAEGRLDFAINAAGINHPPARLAELDPAIFRDVMQTNAEGIFLSMRHEIRAMRETLVRDQKACPAIVNIASVLADAPAPFMAAYGASKHAVIGLTRTAAADHAQEGIRINALSPGPTDTPMFHRALIEIAGDAAKYAGGLPKDGPQSADEVARAALFLCSRAALGFSGRELVLDRIARLR
ncbi:MAG: SDR family oxidoreductase [Alphaproteobacteria bacterium]|nr:MAG: SDR family oxidoreductase [Alphaproteobacteria bacterium]